MALSLAVLALLSGGDTVVLRDKTNVSGRYVRLVDLIDSDRTDEAARSEIAGIYLGRSPEEGQTRVVTLEEIRRELERRGFETEAFSFVGRQVEVSRSGEAPTDALRRTIAFEIKRHLLEDEAEAARADETVIRLLSLHPEDVSPDCQVVEVRSRGASAFTVVLVDPSQKRLEVEVVARVLRTREVAFAVRDIQLGRTVERADLELRRVESSDLESASGNLGLLVGATAAVRIRKGTKIMVADLKLKPVVRKGDIVRACSSTYEVDARALEDGAPAQEILLEFTTSKNRFRAKVAGSARVEVVEVGK